MSQNNDSSDMSSPHYGLIVIDMQNALFEDTQKPYQIEKVVSNMQSVLKEFRKRNLPVVYIQHTEGEEFEEGTHGWQIHPSLAPESEDVCIKKMTWDAFYRTELGSVLHRMNIDVPVFVGMQTEFCFDTTVRSAFAHDYRGIMLSDAHTTFDTAALRAPQIIAHHNSVLCGRFAKGMTTEEFIKQM